MARLKNPMTKAGFAVVKDVLEMSIKMNLELASRHLYIRHDEKVDATLEFKVKSLKSKEVEDFIVWVESNIAPFHSSEDYAGEYSASRTFRTYNELLYIDVVFLLPTDG